MSSSDANWRCQQSPYQQSSRKLDQNESAGSDSDNAEEALVGNVSRFSVIPTGEVDTLRKGVLIFDASFESGNSHDNSPLNPSIAGNLGKVEQVNEFEYDLYIRADTCNPKFRVWFNFTVENNHVQQRVIFNIVNFSKTKSLYREGMSPLVKSTSRPQWSRVPHKNVYYYRCPEHRKNYVMSFAFCFDWENEIYHFSYCFPYTYTRLQSYLGELDKQEYPHYRRELLGLTLQQRRIDLLTITHPINETNMEKQNVCDATGIRKKKGRIVFVTARVHPGETPSSFVCQGFIDFMVSSHPLAQMLRHHLIFKIVPMLNPDGVYLGNYRCSLMGFDLNRQWQDPSEWAHPAIHATKQLLIKFNHDALFDLDFFIDIHAHSTLMNGFMYGNVFEDEERAERQAVFPNLLSQFAEDFSLPQTNFNRDAVKAGTGRRTLGGILDDRTLCYTLEVSFFSYTNMTSSQMVAYTEEKYARLGRNLARTFHEYYANQGLFKRMSSSTNTSTPAVSTGSGRPSNTHSKMDPSPICVGDITSVPRRIDPITNFIPNQSGQSFSATDAITAGDYRTPPRLIDHSQEQFIPTAVQSQRLDSTLSRTEKMVSLLSNERRMQPQVAPEWRETSGGISWRAIPKMNPKQGLTFTPREMQTTYELVRPKRMDSGDQ